MKERNQLLIILAAAIACILALVALFGRFESAAPAKSGAVQPHINRPAENA